MLKEIAQFIENQSDNCGLTIGTNFFTGYLPQKTDAGAEVPDRCVVLLENAGGVPVGQLPDWLDPKALQVWNRARDFWDARDDAWCLFNMLHGLSHVVLPVVSGGPSYDALVIDAVAPPAPIENPNKQNLFVFSTNYFWSISDAP